MILKSFCVYLWYFSVILKSALSTFQDVRILSFVNTDIVCTLGAPFQATTEKVFIFYCSLIVSRFFRRIRPRAYDVKYVALYPFKSLSKSMTTLRP